MDVRRAGEEWKVSDENANVTEDHNYTNKGSLVYIFHVLKDVI